MYVGVFTCDGMCMTKLFCWTGSSIVPWSPHSLASLDGGSSVLVLAREGVSKEEGIEDGEQEGECS